MRIWLTSWLNLIIYKTINHMMYQIRITIKSHTCFIHDYHWIKLSCAWHIILCSSQTRRKWIRTRVERDKLRPWFILGIRQNFPDDHKKTAWKFVQYMCVEVIKEYLFKDWRAIFSILVSLPANQCQILWYKIYRDEYAFWSILKKPVFAKSGHGAQLQCFGEHMYNEKYDWL